MAQIWRKLQTFRHLSWPQRGLWLEAWLWLGGSRLLILTLPFKYIAPHLGHQHHVFPTQIAPETEPIVRQIGWAIHRAADNTPWNSTCLAQGLTAKRMLQQRGISSTLYLGVKKSTKGELIAHAWVRCGDHDITGGHSHGSYTVVAMFTDFFTAPV